MPPNLCRLRLHCVNYNHKVPTWRCFCITANISRQNKTHPTNQIKSRQNRAHSSHVEWHSMVKVPIQFLFKTFRSHILIVILNEWTSSCNSKILLRIGLMKSSDVHISNRIGNPSKRRKITTAAVNTVLSFHGNSRTQWERFVNYLYALLSTTAFKKWPWFLSSIILISVAIQLVRCWAFQWHHILIQRIYHISRNKRMNKMSKLDGE